MNVVKEFNKLDKETVTGLKGGVGEIYLTHFLDETQSLGAGRLFCIFTIPVGNSIGYHQHNGDCETYYILKGKALVNDNGEEFELLPGDVTHCKDGNSHSIKSIGDTDLEYIAIILYTEQKNG